MSRLSCGLTSWFCHMDLSRVISRASSYVQHLKKWNIQHSIKLLFVTPRFVTLSSKKCHMWPLIMWHCHEKVSQVTPNFVTLSSEEIPSNDFVALPGDLVLLQSPNTAVIPECQFLSWKWFAYSVNRNISNTHTHNFYPIISRRAFDTWDEYIHIWCNHHILRQLV